jgi:hypothetical protein
MKNVILGRRYSAIDFMDHGVLFFPTVPAFFSFQHFEHPSPACLPQLTGQRAG